MSKDPYPRPAVTLDVIVWDRRANRILLIKRGKEPFKDCWAIPGGFFNSEDHNNEKQDATLVDGALRELKEETGIDARAIQSSLSFLSIQDKPGRDPRARTLTVVYVLTVFDTSDLNVKGQDDATEAKWFKLEEVVSGKIPLAFDHFDEVTKFYSRIPYCDVVFS